MESEDVVVTAIAQEILEITGVYKGNGNHKWIVSKGGPRVLPRCFDAQAC
jgi:hypothetical protein